VTDRAPLEQATGELFGDLWGPYDQMLFDQSVELFYKRLDLAGIPRERFQGAHCLDAGCGGGRNSIAMARLGASHVTGIDLGVQGLEDARKRSEDVTNVDFQHASILDIPFSDETFDVVWCAGVLMITADEQQALDELARVLKPGGNLYLLVYATEGLRWPLIEWLRPFANQISQPVIERAIEAGGLAANKRRTFLDDLFCPKLDFYTWTRLEQMLRTRGFDPVERWGNHVRLDHEHDLAAYREDLESLQTLFAAGASTDFGDKQALFELAHQGIAATVAVVQWFEDAVATGRMSEDDAMDQVIGQGHHRVWAAKR
jgi:ubiquinone/menaquinone biosynthesis C-methylase UbiE